MAARTRTFNARVTIVGNYYHYAQVPPQQIRTNTVGLRGSCEDRVGERDKVNPLRIVKQGRLIPTMDGKLYSGPTLIVHYDKTPISHLVEPSTPLTAYPELSPVQMSNLAWSTLAGTNPNVPHVAVPTALAELKDLPSLVQGWGQGLLKTAAQGHISWRWAIKPMLSDLSKLIQFQRAVEERIRWLNKLGNEGFIRRRCSLDSSTITYPRSLLTIHTGGSTINAYRTVTYTQKMWGTAQFKLAPGAMIPRNHYETDLLARKLAGGFTSHEALATFWELTPWSWLADWFLGVGTVIDATNNTVPLSWSKISVMRTLTSRSVYELQAGSPPAWVTLSGLPQEDEVQKWRYPVTPLLPFSPSYLPLVDWGKWSILGSLAILKGK